MSKGSINLLDWLPLATVTNTYGTVQFNDAQASGLGLRSYRTVEAEY